MRKTILALGATMLVAGTMSAQGMDKKETTKMVGGAAMYPSKDIIDNAMNSKDHTTLVAAVKAAGLVETLKGKGPFTVFAPTNAASSEALAKSAGADEAHEHMLEKNRAVSSALLRAGASAAPAAAGEQLSVGSVAVTRLSFAPAIGATRSWKDNFPATPVAYSTSVQFVCALPSGRNVVWWVDPTIVSSGKFTAPAWSAAFSAMQTSYCGSAGGLARMTALLGDVWGPQAARYNNIIQDAPGAPQDINVVLLNVPASVDWAGYFFGGNNLLRTSFADSNEALAFFINADQIKSSVNFATSTLLHESTHMVNFYQRTVVRDVSHDTWLEETSAMMTEDIVAPTVIGGYNKVLGERLPAYLATGGNVSYINWPTLGNSAPNYAIGAGFGAFLNRRYGLSIYQQLVTSCRDGVSGNAALTSYACLDALIKAGGGSGFGDEFARFGATVFGQFGAVGTPASYGYPAVVSGGYSLQAKDLSVLPPAPASALFSGNAAASHTHQRDTIAAGKASYVRNGVIVPANTSLTVVIK